MKYKLIAFMAFAASLMMSCTNPMTFETKVHEDGSLDKTVVLEKTDSARIQNNIFSINEQAGWSVNIQELPPDKTEDKRKKEFKIQFQKHFSNVEEMNKVLDKPSDAQFQINSKFEKKFRWFYTYIRYSETFRPVNRFKMVLPGDYFNREDNAFLDRLPAEGKAISKADSLYLQLLNEKISDHFAAMGIFTEQYSIMEEVIKRNGLGNNWLDTLQKNQEFIYNHIDKMKGDPHFGEKIADSLKIPLHKPKSSRDFADLSANLNNRIDFMSFARDGKYQNVIDMPWKVVGSNADSVSGTKLYWHPLVTKFIYRDYEMFAESRKLNLWACLLSVVIISGTIYLFLRRRPSMGK